MQQPWTRWTAFICGWTVLGFLLSIEIYFNVRAEMSLSYIDFTDLAIPQFGRVIMWGLLAPLILQLRAKVPLRSGRWIGGTAFHLLMSFVVMGTFYVGRCWAYQIWWGGVDDFWHAVFAGFYGRNLIDMAFYWAVLGVGYSWEIHQRYRSEELKAAQLESKLMEAELKALREQLHPHFLFNTLNTISVLVREQKNEEAVALIARLSTLLRMALDTVRTHEVTLRQELDFLERYIDIQKARFPHQLTVNLAVEPEALEARIPHLLLQPLVENAIVHGVAPKPAPGLVNIDGYVRNGKLHLEVRDDGMGFDANGDRTQEGIGLSNTRERIAKIYGTAGQLSLRSARGRGVSVAVVIPFRK